MGAGPLDRWHGAEPAAPRWTRIRLGPLLSVRRGAHWAPGHCPAETGPPALWQVGFGAQEAAVRGPPVDPLPRPGRAAPLKAPRGSMQCGVGVGLRPAQSHCPSPSPGHWGQTGQADSRADQPADDGPGQLSTRRGPCAGPDTLTRGNPADRGPGSAFLAAL